MAKLTATPTQIVIDPDFNGAERKKIVDSVNSWNTQSRLMLSSHFYRIANLPMDSQAKRFDPRSCERNGAKSETVYLVREQSQSHWEQMSLASDALAVTQRCVNGSELLNQVVIINADRISPQQFHSVVLHELGHGIGLNHSCSETKGKTDYRDCDSLTVQHPYRLALMFPKIDHVQPVEALTENDQERAACLYKEE